MKFVRKYSLLFILLLSVTSVYAQTEQTMGQRVEDLLGNLYRDVKSAEKATNLYFDIAVTGCRFELLVNDFPVYRDATLTSLQSAEHKVLINSAILKSGVQTWELRILPVTTGATREISVSEDVRFKLSYAKMRPRFDGRQVMLGEPEVLLTTPTVVENGAEVYARAGKSGIIYKGTFEADVPYELKGWSKSVDLNTLNKTDLMNKLVEQYENFGKLLHKGQVDKIAELIHTRSAEAAQYLFYSKCMNKNAVQEVWESYGLSNPHVIRPTNYKMVIFGDGKLVALERADIPYEPVLSVESTVDGKEYVTKYRLFFHIPEGGERLEIIR